MWRETVPKNLFISFVYTQISRYTEVLEMKCIECMKRDADPKTGLCVDCRFENETEFD